MSSDDEFEQFLRSTAALGAPTAADALRVKERLSSSLAWKRGLPEALSGELRTARAPSPAPAARPVLRARFGGLAAVAISVAGLSAVTFAIVTAPVAPNAAATAGDAPAAPSPEPSADDAPPAQEERRADPILAAPTFTAPATSPAVRSAPSSAKSARRAGSLDDEVALLAETNAAIQTKRPARALALVERHAREFPRGALGPEFDAQRVQALSALGREREACALASRFLSTHPTSPLAPQVRSSCESIR